MFQLPLMLLQAAWEALIGQKLTAGQHPSVLNHLFEQNLGFLAPLQQQQQRSSHFSARLVSEEP